MIAVPSTAPELKVSPLSATSLELTWKELNSSQARGVIMYYKIFYKKHEEHVQDITVQNITVPSDILRYELNGKPRFRAIYLLVTRIYLSEGLRCLNFKVELDRFTSTRLSRLPIVPIVRTADCEADCDCYRLSTEMPCL